MAYFYWISKYTYSLDGTTFKISRLIIWLFCFYHCLCDQGKQNSGAFPSIFQSYLCFCFLIQGRIFWALRYCSTQVSFVSGLRLFYVSDVFKSGCDLSRHRWGLMDGKSSLCETESFF